LAPVRLRRRDFLHLAALAVPAAGLAACGALPNVLPEQPFVQQKPVTLNFYYGPFFVQGGGQSPEGKLMAGILANYLKANPKVTINATEVTQGVFANFEALLDPSSTSHADVFLGQFVGRFGNFNLQDAISPVDSYLKREKDLTAAQFYPAALHKWWIAGKQLGLPRDIQPTNVIYYNRGILKSAGISDPSDGWTTDDFLHFLQSLENASQSAPVTNPQHWAYVDIDPTTGLSEFVSIFGGRQSNYPEQPPRAMFDSSQAIDGARYYTDLYLKYHVAPDRFARAGAYSLSPLPEFLLGHVPLLLAPTNLIPTIQSVQHPLDWDLTMEPIKTDVKQSWNGYGLGMFIMKAATDPDAVWNLVKYLVAGDGMKERAAQGDVHPAVKKIAESSDYTTNRTPLGKRLFNTIGMNQMIDVDPSTIAPTTPVPGTPVPGSSPDYRAMSQEIYYDLDDVLSGKMDPAEMMRTATQKANAGLTG